jgi:hypothetical protein
MSSLLKAFGLITGCVSVSYLTVTAMMHDTNKPYRGHLNVIKGGISTKNIYTPIKTSENTDVSQNLTLDQQLEPPCAPSTSQSPLQAPRIIFTL